MSNNCDNLHQSNAGNFEKIIQFCIDLNSAYSPSESTLQIKSLQMQMARAQATLKDVNYSKHLYENAVREREIAFAPLKTISLAITNLLVYVMSARSNEAASLNIKIQGKRKSFRRSRMKSIARANSILAIQQSYDKLLENYIRLIELAASEPLYLPADEELKIEALKEFMNDMRIRNNSVSNAMDACRTSCINRNKIFYTERNCLCETSINIKAYLASVYGYNSLPFKQINNLSLSRTELSINVPSLRM